MLRKTGDNDLWLRVDQPCMVMVQAKGNSIQKLVVSDPSQRLAKLELEINRKIETSGDSWTSQWDGKKKSTSIMVNLPQEGYAGQSVILILGKERN